MTTQVCLLTVTISGGSTEASFTVQIVQDSIDDDGEAIHIVVSSEPDGVSAGAITVVTINITDDDEPSEQ